MFRFLLLAALAAFQSCTLSALKFAIEDAIGEESEAPAPVIRHTSRSSFTMLKTHVGKWSNPKTKDTLLWELSSEGTLLVEKVNAGTRNEQTNLYFLDDDTLSLLHFCPIGNQPRLAATTLDEASVEFNLQGGEKRSRTTGQMVRMVIHFNGDAHMTQKWTFKNQKEETSTLEWVRNTSL